MDKEGGLAVGKVNCSSAIARVPRGRAAGDVGHWIRKPLSGDEPDKARCEVIRNIKLSPVMLVKSGTAYDWPDAS